MPVDAGVPLDAAARPGGGLTPAEVAATVDRQRARIQACAGDEVASVGIMLQIDASGRVTMVRLAGTVGDRLRECVERFVRATQFPERPVGTTAKASLLFKRTPTTGPVEDPEAPPGDPLAPPYP